MSDIAVTVTSPGSVNATIGVGGAVSATVSTGGSVAVNLPGGEAAWANITGKPTEFTAAAHTHQAADITDRSTALVTSVNGQTGDITITEGGGGASLSDASPAALGVAAAGVSLEASRADHVHNLPTAADVGALDENSVIDGGDYVGYIPSNVITITQQPADATAIAGEASFSVAATVEPSGTLSYQWQLLAASGAGEVWQAIQGATAATLSLSGLMQNDDQSQYRVVLSAEDAAPVTSNTATLTVTGDSLTIVVSPSQYEAFIGNPWEFSGTVSGANQQGITYQWQKNTGDPSDESQWFDRLGETAAAIFRVQAQSNDAGWYRLVVYRQSESFVSNAARLLVAIQG